MEKKMIINCDTAEELIQVWYHEHQEQEGQRLFRRLQEQLDHQSQQNKLFIETVDALEEQYGRRLYAAKQLLDRYESNLVQLDQDIQHLEQQKKTVQHQIQRYEHDLPLLQQYAHNRHQKRAKRQRQYDVLYWIPFISSQYKLKYMRARDKFAKAEHQVAQIRHAMASCHQTWRRLTTSLTHTRDQHEQSREHWNEIEKQWQQLDNSLQKLDEGRQFWYDFEKYQTFMVMESMQYLIQQEHQSTRNKKSVDEALASSSSSSSSSSSMASSSSESMMMDAWIKTFKMACFEYDECFQHGQERWFTIQVEFDCALCNNVCCEWPCLDTIHGLLCHTCQESILETKRNMEQWTALQHLYHSGKRVSNVPSSATLSKKKTKVSLVSDQASSIKNATRRPLVIKRLLKNMFGKCSSPKRPYSPLVH